MILGKLKIIVFVLIFLLKSITFLFAADKIETVPLINLEELSPTFEEDKDILEKKDENGNNLVSDDNFTQEKLKKKKGKIYINIKALDKITAKTQTIKLGIGEKKHFGSLELDVQADDFFPEFLQRFQAKVFQNTSAFQISKHGGEKLWLGTNETRG